MASSRPILPPLEQPSKYECEIVGGVIVILGELLGGQCHLMHGTIKVIHDFRRIRLARRGELPSGIGVEMTSVGNRGGVPSRQE